MILHEALFPQPWPEQLDPSPQFRRAHHAALARDACAANDCPPATGAASAGPVGIANAVPPYPEGTPFIVLWFDTAPPDGAHPPE